MNWNDIEIEDGIDQYEEALTARIENEDLVRLHHFTHREVAELRAAEPVPVDLRDWRRAHITRREFARTAVETREAERENEIRTALSFAALSNGMGMPLSPREYELEREMAFADEEMMGPATMLWSAIVQTLAEAIGTETEPAALAMAESLAAAALEPPPTLGFRVCLDVLRKRSVEGK